MKYITGILFILAAVIYNAGPATAQQSKENFEKRNPQKKGFFNIFSSGKSGRIDKNSAATARILPHAAPGNKRSADPTEWNKNQRQQAEAIWQKQRDFRTKQREKLTKREPTAWELAYYKEEKTRQKQLKKLLKERDKQVASRAKSKQKAMAAAAKYKRKKVNQPPEKSQQSPTVFSSAISPAGAGTGSRKK